MCCSLLELYFLIQADDISWLFKDFNAKCKCVPSLSGMAPRRSISTQARRRSTQPTTRGGSIQTAQWRLSTLMAGRKPTTPPDGSGSKTKMATSSWTTGRRNSALKANSSPKAHFGAAITSKGKLQQVSNKSDLSLVVLIHLSSGRSEVSCLGRLFSVSAYCIKEKLPAGVASRHESGINLLIELLARKQVSVFPEISPKISFNTLTCCQKRQSYRWIVHRKWIWGSHKRNIWNYF